jgi:hypothetical protein
MSTSLMMSCSSSPCCWRSLSRSPRMISSRLIWPEWVRAYCSARGCSGGSCTSRLGRSPRSVCPSSRSSPPCGSSAASSRNNPEVLGVVLVPQVALDLLRPALCLHPPALLLADHLRKLEALALDAVALARSLPQPLYPLLEQLYIEFFAEAGPLGGLPVFFELDGGLVDWLAGGVPSERTFLRCFLHGRGVTY